MPYIRNTARIVLALLLISVFFIVGCAKEPEVAEKCALSLNLNPPEYQSRKVIINGGVGAPVKNIQWDWGDGSQARHQFFPASHTYLNPGQYDVKVTAFSIAKNCSEQKVIKVQIN
jgi:hypothetical protein